MENVDGKESTDETAEEKEEEWQEAHKSHSHAEVVGSFSGTPAALHAKVADILNIVFSVKFPCNVVYNYMYILNLNITCGHLPVCPGYCKEEAAKTPQPAGSTSRSTIEQVEKTGWGGVCTVSMYVSVGAHETAK